MPQVESATAELTALEALHEISVLAAGGRNVPAAVARLAGEHACRLLDVEAAAVFEWDEAVGLLVPVYETPSAITESSMKPGEGMVGRAFETGAPVVVRDYQDFDGALARSRGRGMGGAVAVPMMVDGRTTGVLGVWAYTPRDFTDAEVQLLSLFAAHVAPTVVAARRGAARDRRQQVLRALHDLAVTASGFHESDAVAKLACERACEMLGAQAAYVLWHEPEAGHLRCLACSGEVLRPPGWTTVPGEGISGVAFTTRTAVTVEDYSAWEGALDWARPGGMRTMTAVPLVVRNQPLGAMVVSWHELRQVTPDVTDTLLLLAAQVAADLEGARLLETSASQVRSLRALYDAAVASSGLLDPAALSGIAVDRARDVMGVDSASLRWYDANRNALLLLATNDTHGVDLVPETAPGVGTVGLAFSRRRPVVIERYQEASDGAGWARDLGVAAALAVPLLVRDQAVGVLAVGSYSEHSFTPEDIRNLQLLAAQLAPALEAARLAGERERDARVFETLERFASASAGVLDADRLSEMAVHAAGELTPGGVPAIGLWDGESTEMVILHSRTPVIRQRIREGALIEAFRNRAPVVIEDYLNDPAGTPEWRRFGIRSFVGVPVANGDRVIGALCLAFREPRRFDPADVRALQLLAGQVGPALAAAGLHADLARSEDLLRGIYRTMAAGLVVIDAENECVIEANDAALRMLGISRSELDGRQPAEIAGFDRLNPDHQPMPVRERPVARAIRTRRPVHRAVVGYRRRDGSVFWLQHDAVPILAEDGRVDRVVNSFIDVTEVRAAETARRENEEKTRFLASMSHELRTPLNSVLGFSQLLGDEAFGPLNERQRRYLGHIETSGRHLLELVNDILDLSKVAAGQMDVHPETVSVAESVEAVLGAVRPQLDAGRLGVDTAIPPRLAVRADPRRLEQVLSNLLSNAIKFTGEGGRIGIDARRRGAEVVVTVRDTGIGIARPHQRRIFDEFTQVDGGRSREHDGTGLGLPLSKRLLELMGGRIWVRSAEGAGSAFSFALPAAD